MHAGPRGCGGVHIHLKLNCISSDHWNNKIAFVDRNNCIQCFPRIVAGTCSRLLEAERMFACNTVP